MPKLIIQPGQALRGRIQIPGDKSMSHRALIFSSLCSQSSQITHLLESADVHSTEKCLNKLGCVIERTPQGIIVHPRPYIQNNPVLELDCGNSGTTMRLLMGLLSAQQINPHHNLTLIGDQSLSKRPMARVSTPLQSMGAQISLENSPYAPVHIKRPSGGQLSALKYSLPVASAQIKSALILAALFTDDVSQISGRIDSRDHTERMLAMFNVEVLKTTHAGNPALVVNPGQKFQAISIRIPGDPSTAAFWMAAAALLPESEICCEHVSINSTRCGLLNLLQKIGAHVLIEPVNNGPEPTAHITVSYNGPLKAFELYESDIPSLIDEIPILAVLATQTRGTTHIRGAQELRFKESDRIESIAFNLRAMGVELEVHPDGLSIPGPQKINAAAIKSFHDHRIAMAFSVAALLVEKSQSTIDHPECVQISYPEFYSTLHSLQGVQP